VSISKLVADPALRERRTASDYVAEALRRAILNGEFADGEELNQVELAEHFNVSRVPIREALRRLEAEGLIVAAPHRRAVVLGFTPARIAEIFEARALLEGFMLERAAPHLTSEQLDELRGLVDELAAVNDHTEWLDANRRFHERLWDAQSVTVRAIVVQLTSQVERYLRRVGGLDRAGEANAEHRAIVEALAADRADDAVRILRDHIARTGRVIQQRLDAIAADVA